MLYLQRETVWSASAEQYGAIRCVESGVLHFPPLLYAQQVLTAIFFLPALWGMLGWESGLNEWRMESCHPKPTSLAATLVSQTSILDRKMPANGSPLR